MSNTTWAAARRTAEAFNKTHNGTYLELATRRCEPLTAAEIEVAAQFLAAADARALFRTVRLRKPSHAELIRTGQQLARMGFAFHKYRTTRIWHLDTRADVAQTEPTP